ERLFEDIRHGDVVSVQRLLNMGANPNAREIVLTKPSLSEHSKGNEEKLGDTALMVAAHEGHLNIVKLLLHRGADVNGRGMNGFTPLITAASRRHRDIVRLLIARGARPNQRNDNGDTAIIFAANAGQTSLVDVLLRKRADINGGTGWTPLMEAAYN